MNGLRSCDGCNAKPRDVTKWVIVLLGSVVAQREGLNIVLCETCGSVIAKAIDGKMKELIGAAGNLPKAMLQ